MNSKVGMFNNMNNSNPMYSKKNEKRKRPMLDDDSSSDEDF